MSTTILVVDDEAAVVRVCTAHLESRGYRVLQAVGPDHALRVAAAYEGSIDVLLADVVMPEIDGCRLAAQLSVTRPDLGVVYMSGQEEGRVTQYARTGLNDLILLWKPFSRSELFDAVDRRLAALNRPSRSESQACTAISSASR
jgi:two-component system, cell cycle sensor histidine kinase and response regulator CckA